MQRTIVVIAAVLVFVLFVVVQVDAQSTPTPTVVAEGVVLKDANLRAGPGTTYAIVGGVKAGVVVKIVGTNPAKTWYKLGDKVWIAVSLVRKIVSLPTATPTVTRTVTPTSSITVTVIVSTPTPAPTRILSIEDAAIVDLMTQSLTTVVTLTKQLSRLLEIGLNTEDADWQVGTILLASDMDILGKRLMRFKVKEDRDLGYVADVGGDLTRMSDNLLAFMNSDETIYLSLLADAMHDMISDIGQVARLLKLEDVLTPIMTRLTKAQNQ